MYLHDINNIKKNTTILLNHWISEIIIKTTFNNILKDGVTSALRMMCVDMLWAVAFSDEYT
jgi:hypothetical protein